MFNQGAKHICHGAALSIAINMMTVVTLNAAIGVSVDDVSGPPGMLTSIVRVTGDSVFDSASIALGSTLTQGNTSSRLTITAFDPVASADSVWQGGVQAAAAPSLPAAATVLSLSQNDAADPSGTLLRVTIDATQAAPGDVFTLDPNFGNVFSKFSLKGALAGPSQYDTGTLRILEVLDGIPGDYNGDQVVDALDIDLLSAAVREKSTNPLYDADRNGIVEKKDRDFWVEDIKRTYYGDADLNLQFDDSDFVTMLIAGEYLDGVDDNSTWASGDANGDADFSPEDFVTMFIAGGYLAGPRPPAAVAAVPEPSATLLAALAAACLFHLRRRSPNMNSRH